MKHLFRLAPLACLYALSCPAQDLTTNTTAYSGPPVQHAIITGPHHDLPPQKQWLWKKEHDQVNGHIDRTLLKTMTKTTQAIVGLLRDSCLSEGP